jgi:hypothetical protein
MSAPESEGGQDRDDILGFPGDGYEDPQDGDPPETMDEDLDSGASNNQLLLAPAVPRNAGCLHPAAQQPVASRECLHPATQQPAPSREAKDYTSRGSSGPSYGWSGAPSSSQDVRTVRPTSPAPPTNGRAQRFE